MQQTPNQIKNRLTEALDEDNNVVNLAQVVEVISTLETYPITRQALEQTRIGKLVNELRKKTSDTDLAKRAKCLVREWQKLVPSTDNKSVNGNNQSQDKRTVPKLSTPLGSRTSSPRCPGTPVISPGQRTDIPSKSSCLSVTSSSHRVSPSVKYSSSNSSSPKNILNLPVVSTSRSQSPKTNNNSLNCDKNRVNHVVKSNVANHRHDSPPDKYSDSSLNRRKRTHSIETDDSCDKPTKIAALIPAKSSKRYAKYKDLQLGKINGVVAHASKLLSTPKDKIVDDDNDKNKTPKVKTTAQIIESLQKSANMKSNVGKSIDFIEREIDDINPSVVPDEVLPRSRRKDRLQLPDIKPKRKALNERMSQTKVELVEKYLETLQPPNVIIKRDPSPLTARVSPNESHSTDSQPIKQEKRSRSLSPPCLSPAVEIKVDPDPSFVEPDPSSVEPSATLLDLFAQLPALNLDEITYDDEYLEVTPGSLGTEADVDRLHNESWSHVNGIYDYDNEFHDWTRTLTLRSYDDEPLHILPYVIMDKTKSSDSTGD